MQTTILTTLRIPARTAGQLMLTLLLTLGGTAATPVNAQSQRCVWTRVSTTIT